MQRHNEKLRRRYWRRLVGPLARPLALPPIPVSGTCDWYTLGPLQVGCSRIGASGFVRDAALIATGGLASHLLLLLTLRGGLSGRAGGEAIELRKGDIAFLNLGCTLEVEASDGTYLGLLVPHDIVHGDACAGLVLRESHLPSRMLASHLEQLVSEAAAAGALEAEALARSTIAVVQLCLDFAPSPQRESAQTLRLRILAYMDANLHEPELGPDLIARTFHISRTWLYRIFAGSGGVRRCIRDKRLDAAFRDLCEEPRRRVIEIAWHRGFASERYFQRAFAERFGLNPSDVRDRSRQGLPVELP